MAIVQFSSFFSLGRRAAPFEEEQKALMRCLELMPKEFPEVARSMPHWRARAAAG